MFAAQRAASPWTSWLCPRAPAGQPSVGPHARCPAACGRRETGVTQTLNYWGKHVPFDEGGARALTSLWFLTVRKVPAGQGREASIPGRLGKGTGKEARGWGPPAAVRTHSSGPAHPLAPGSVLSDQAAVKFTAALPERLVISAERPFSVCASSQAARSSRRATALLQIFTNTNAKSNTTSRSRGARPGEPPPSRG